MVTWLPRKARWCPVEGCSRWPAGFVSRADLHGPAGFRCLLHGAGCTVPGCRNHTWGRVDQADLHGPSGRRCWVHGGKTCSIPGCTLPPRRRIQLADSFGPPGIRCDEHSYRCSRRLGPKIAPARMSLRHARAAKAKPESAAAAGPRCRLSDGKGYHCDRPPKGGGTLCEHHWALRQQQPARRGKAAASFLLARSKGTWRFMRLNNHF